MCKPMPSIRTPMGSSRTVPRLSDTRPALVCTSCDIGWYISRWPLNVNVAAPASAQRHLSRISARRAESRCGWGPWLDGFAQFRTRRQIPTTARAAAASYQAGSPASRFPTALARTVTRPSLLDTSHRGRSAIGPVTQRPGARGDRSRDSQAGARFT